MTLRRLFLVAALAVVAGTIVFAARPQPVTPADRVDRIAAELRCPVCQGLSVRDSPSETAREMRDLVAVRVAEGRSDDEIRDEFRRSYGDWIVLSPPVLGWSGLIWLLPILLVAGGFLVAGGALARRAGASAAPPTPAELAALRERVAEEESTS